MGKNKQVYTIKIEAKIEEKSFVESPIEEKHPKANFFDLSNLRGIAGDYNIEKDNPKQQVSIYLDEDVIVAFNIFGKMYGKGSKSELVNSFLRSTLLKVSK